MIAFAVGKASFATVLTTT